MQSPARRVLIEDVVKNGHNLQDFVFIGSNLDFELDILAKSNGVNLALIFVDGLQD